VFVVLSGGQLHAEPFGLRVGTAGVTSDMVC